MNRRRLAASVALLVASTLAACGVPVDEEPRAIAQTTIPPASASPTTVATDAGGEVSVYFLRDDQLERQDYPVEGEPTLEQAIGFVLEPPAADADELRSSVPPGTALRSVEVADGIASIDLTGEINDVTGLAQKEAFAQIVFTTLAFPTIEAVRFLVDGEPIAAPTDQGNQSLVRSESYDKPLNPR